MCGRRRKGSEGKEGVQVVVVFVVTREGVLCLGERGWLVGWLVMCVETETK